MELVDRLASRMPFGERLVQIFAWERRILRHTDSFGRERRKPPPSGCDHRTLGAKKGAAAPGGSPWMREGASGSGDSGERHRFHTVDCEVAGFHDVFPGAEGDDQPDDLQ